MIEPDAYCREIEAYLCRKNDGHLIRLVGPSFERVLSWAQQGVPVKVAQAGIDRYFERYYRKGPRRRPVRVEFCDADVLDAFDEWRRAVGVSLVVADPDGGPPVEEPGPPPTRARRSLASHLDTVLARLTVLRGSDRLGGTADAALDAAIRGLEGLRHEAQQARGDARTRVIDRMDEVGRGLLGGVVAALADEELTVLRSEAAREIEPFRSRLDAASYHQAHDAAVGRLVRERYGLPDFTF